MLIRAALLCLIPLSFTAFAYDPPVDTAGPLTVRMQAPAMGTYGSGGFVDGLVVWHRWQRWGYDYRLPDIYPPDPEWGTDEEFRQMIEICRRNNIRFAPHDNYIDFYPDSNGFSYDSIVFRADGQPQRAWFNYSRGAQSYRSRPDRLMPYVERNLRLIRPALMPTAHFIDVWSSMASYDLWIQDGRFVTRDVTQKAWGGVFAWIRDHLGDNAPQISEAGRDKLIGWLDGSDAQQMRVEPAAKSFAWVIRWSKLPWQLAVPSQAEVLREDGSVAETASVRREGGDVVLECAAGVFAYRLK